MVISYYHKNRVETSNESSVQINHIVDGAEEIRKYLSSRFGPQYKMRDSEELLEIVPHGIFIVEPLRHSKHDNSLTYDTSKLKSLSEGMYVWIAGFDGSVFFYSQYTSNIVRVTPEQIKEKFPELASIIAEFQAIPSI